MKTIALFGDREVRNVYLTVRERALLRRASLVLEELRARLEDDREDYDDETTVDVALAAHTCRELADEGQKPIL